VTSNLALLAGERQTMIAILDDATRQLESLTGA